MPSVVCLTLVVPHSAVAMFDDIRNRNGTPICQLQVNSSVSMKEYFYTDIQLGFGNLTTTGTPFTNDFKVCVEDDQAGCNGKSPLIVSAMVSSGSLVEYGDTAAHVIFGLKATMANTISFASKLGIFLHVHTSAVGRRDVFVSRFRPNMSGNVSVQCAPVSAHMPGKMIEVLHLPRFH